MSSDAAEAPPKVFISYRWSSPEHEEWVLLLATSLRQSGVNVILDKWHLSEGQDTLAFMESMVSDPTVQKVLMICDAGYVERANNRQGGVGTEAQIISPKVYESVDQNKFAAIVVQLDADGRPLLPHYMSTRLYFDFSNDDAEATNFEKLVRWIFGKPFHAAPPIGEPPKFLDEARLPAGLSSTSSQRLRRAQTTGVGGFTAAANALEDIARNCGELILTLKSEKNIEETVYGAIKESFNIIEDVYRAILELIRSDNDKSADIIHDFFEAVLSKWDYAPVNQTYNRWDNDVLHYFGHECFVGFVAIAMQERAFVLAADVLSMPFYKARAHERTGEAVSYAELRPYLESLESRNRTQNLRRLSLHADLIAEHHEHSLVSFSGFLEADLTLYARGLLTGQEWYPISGVYLGHSFGALPTYVRATSERFYKRLQPFLLNQDAPTFRTNLQAALSQSRGLRFDYREISVSRLLNLENLGTSA